MSDKVTVTLNRDEAEALVLLPLAMTENQHEARVRGRRRISAALESEALRDTEMCERCGRGSAVWSAQSPLWNEVIRGGSINGEPMYNDMVCASCFMELAEGQGVATKFRVTAEDVAVELETTTPSGRVWDENSLLWVEPAESGGDPR